MRPLQNLATSIHFRSCCQLDRRRSETCPRWYVPLTFFTFSIRESQCPIALLGQHLLWTEQSGPSNLDSIVWPRAAASAELFWSGPGHNVSDALPRLHDFSFRLQQRGVNAIPLQPLWCALRPGACDVNA